MMIPPRPSKTKVVVVVIIVVVNSLEYSKENKIEFLLLYHLLKTVAKTTDLIQ